MNPDIQVFPTTEALSVAFGGLLESILREKPDSAVALSGGSTPQAIFDVLASRFADRIAWSRLSLFWGDERCVPPDHEQSNYRMALLHLISRVPIDPGRVHRIRGEIPAEDAAAEYEATLSFRLPTENGVPVFDLVLLGLGEDGHTVSIFPNRIDLWDSPRFCETASHPDTGQKRVTLTGKVIDAARRIVFLVTGSGKARVVSQILRGTDDSERFPASRVERTKSLWMLDADAAALIGGESG